MGFRGSRLATPLLALGGLFAGGCGGARFGPLDDVDQLSLRVKASFWV